ncbi:unnamed protein product [Microthlaspi erraticum]|uniref:SWIM-type domain-containing protein n=1 Tax=Microthlaspi erraticum TaxID=1685480 RepID=A0A6D2KY83_9BRAS|nr:unnamed protein product [Microthlaspi erraticum]
MVYIAAVYGKWDRRDKGTWFFEVDDDKGGRLFSLRDGCTYVELVDMAKDDYGVDKNAELLQIGYPLPDIMLQQLPIDSPPTFVTTDRQVQSLIELSRTYVLRLCVSSQQRNHMKDDVPVADNVEHDSEWGLSSDDEDWDVHSHEDNEAEEEWEDDPIPPNPPTDWSKGDIDETEADYSVYGRVVDEDVREKKVPLDDIRLKGRCYNEGGRFDKHKDAVIIVGQRFGDKEELLCMLRLMALVHRFSFHVFKSTPELFVAICNVQGCAWRVRAAVKNEPTAFWVTKYVDTHTCSVVDRIAHRRSCTAKYIGALFMERVGIIEGIVPQHIAISMKVMFGLKLSYTSSYRALKAAQEYVRGTAEEGYANLASYLQRIKEANPGTITDLVRDGMDRFMYCFVSFRASIVGFQYVRRVIVVDGTHLTGKYGGVLLVAAGQDGNFQVFPLAVAVVDAENNESWGWFFNKLKSCFTEDFPLVIVSDRHPAIANAIESVLPWATRGICYYHMQNNIIGTYHAKEIMYMVKGAAYAHTVDTYNWYMDQIRAAKPALATYLEGADPSLWSRVHCPGERYNLKTSNIAESINAMVKKAKDFPIPFLLEFIRERLSHWFLKRRENALGLTTDHSKGVEYLLSIREYYAGFMDVERIDDWHFQVKSTSGYYNVDLELRTCSCGVFDIEKIPCSHVIAAITMAGLSVSDYVSPAYKRNTCHSTYAHPLFPPPSRFSSVKKERCRPPKEKPTPGRKKKSRWQSWLEMARKRKHKPRKMPKAYTCSKCRLPGHTRPKCVSETTSLFILSRSFGPRTPVSSNRSYASLSLRRMT